MKGRIFVDTNILIYAHDLDAGPRHDIAASAIEELWENENGVMSTQVLQEFYVNITRKIKTPLSRAHARGIIENYLSWHIPLLTEDLNHGQKIEGILIENPFAI